jgi:hypothetical protein
MNVLWNSMAAKSSRSHSQVVGNGRSSSSRLICYYVGWIWYLIKNLRKKISPNWPKSPKFCTNHVFAATWPMESFNHTAEIKGRSIFDGVMMPNPSATDCGYVNWVSRQQNMLGSAVFCFPVTCTHENCQDLKARTVVPRFNRHPLRSSLCLTILGVKFLLCNWKKMGLKRDKFHRNGSKCCWNYQIQVLDLRACQIRGCCENGQKINVLQFLRNLGILLGLRSLRCDKFSEKIFDW